MGALVKGNRSVVLLDVIGLSLDHLREKGRIPHIAGLLDRGHLLEMEPVFPAVTLPVQASLTTGDYPETHGVVANGFYFRDHFHVAFWEQAAALVESERLWDRLKRKFPGLKTACLFFQNTLYAQCDALITPRPLHTDSGVIPWCYSKPPGLYEEIVRRIGEFKLMSYWGPLASIESSRWIAQAAVEVMRLVGPHLLLVYLPHLDYASQKAGPRSQETLDALREVDAEVGRIMDGVRALGLEGETIYVLLSEYAFFPVREAIALNRIFRDAGLLATRNIGGRDYLDLEFSEAFAMVDHQVAHIYTSPKSRSRVRDLVGGIEGIDHCFGEQEKRVHRVAHRRAGDWVAVSARDRWFSYGWWDGPERAPDFAGHVDIHRKPGYDPLELFLEPGSFHIAQDTNLIKGSHGYPPVSKEDRVPLVISKEARLGDWGPGPVSVTRVPDLIEKIFSS
jgi:predicted AlkP superfamily pyrophosphatase or phosphodiesterase